MVSLIPLKEIGWDSRILTGPARSAVMESADDRRRIHGVAAGKNTGFGHGRRKALLSLINTTTTGFSSHIRSDNDVTDETIDLDASSVDDFCAVGCRKAG